MIRAAAFLVFLASPILAHDGFEDLRLRGVGCCGGHDCKSIPSDWIHATKAGFMIEVPAGQWEDKLPKAYFPYGASLEWKGEPGLSPDGTTIACVGSSMGGTIGTNFPVPPSAFLRCLYMGGMS